MKQQLLFIVLLVAWQHLCLASGFRLHKPRQYLMNLLVTNGEGAEERLYIHRCDHSDPLKANCYRALDGDSYKEWSLCTSTKTDFMPYWVGYLEVPAYITRVVIHTVQLPQSDLTSGLTDFSLSVGGSIACYRHASSQLFDTRSFPCDSFGEDIRIRSNLKSYLAICEVEGYGVPVSFTGLDGAPADLTIGNCAQSSEATPEQVCQNSYDRNFEQTETPGNPDGKLCAVTAPDETAYLVVYLKQPGLISHVKLYFALDLVANMSALHVRSNENLCMADQSEDVKDANGEVILTGLKRADQPIFDCASKFGSYVQVQSQVKEKLIAICQIQVFGYNMIIESEQQYIYQGCFKDNHEEPDLELMVSSTWMTPIKCHKICKRRNKPKFGLQNGQVCFCGTKHGKYGPSTNCTLACSEDKSVACGGYLSNSVYQIVK